MLLRTTLLCSTSLSLLSTAVAQAVETALPSHTETANGALQYQLGDAAIRRWSEGGVAQAAIRRHGGAWQPLLEPDDHVHMTLADFDPLVAEPQLPGVLAAPNGTRLHMVQFQTQVLSEYRDAVTTAGAEILHYLPANVLCVRADSQVVAKLRQLPCVRWVGPLQNGFKLDAELRAFVGGAGEALNCNLVLARKADRETLADQVTKLGGQVTELCDGSTMIRAKLTPTQLVAAMSLDTLVWADPVGGIGTDMDNARIQGGANYVEQLGGYNGLGVRAEITEGLDQTHPDWTFPVLLRTDDLQSHGHCTSMIVGGNGSGNAAARGMLPNGTIIENSYIQLGSGQHFAMIVGSTNPALPWHSMVATASWGSNVTSAYTSVSQTMDDALFVADLARTQSQSNQNSTLSRPEAWAKNIISVGAIVHHDNSSPADDNWAGASIGPAADGRLKPDICAYYDLVLTGDRPGSAGYTATNYFTGFNGTSAATPIVAGHVGIIQQMFTDGLFGNPLPLPATPANRFENRPHMTTSKALLCNSAAQYAFSGTGHNLTRTHQGWGFPSLGRLYDNRKQVVVIDEYDTLQQGESRSYFVWIAPGTPEFRATMVYADPAGSPAASIELINNANLKVTRTSDGTFWWGNNGLNAGTASTSGGVPNARDNIECVYLASPTPGIYMVTVEATSIVQDGKVETPQLDLDYALVVHPVGGGYHNDTGMTLDLSSTGPGNLTITAANAPAAGWTEGYTALSFSTNRGLGFGRFFGLEDDSLTVTLWGTAAAADNAFHFTNAGAGSFPFTGYVFPIPSIISFLAGIQVDGVTMLFDASGNIVAQSNVDRLTLQ